MSIAVYGYGANNLISVYGYGVTVIEDIGELGLLISKGIELYLLVEVNG